jgi:dihydrolipoamide dehydrogenase
MAYDLIVVGAGPGGYVAAVRAAQLGLKVACVERENRLGGVCLNVGCIPSKALLDSSEYYQLVKDRLAEHGIQTGKAEFDLKTMMARKEKVVEDLTTNVRKLLEGQKIDIIHGTGSLAGADRLEVVIGAAGSRKAERQTLQAKAILLATGSRSLSIPGMDFDGKRLINSTQALSLDSVPKHLGIIGGGYIGLELGSVWLRLGSRVTVIEMLPKIAGNLDGTVSRKLQGVLKRQGLTFLMKTRAAGVVVKKNGVSVKLEGGTKQDSLDCDRLLVCVGRRALTDGLRLEEVGVKIDAATGCVVVDTHYRTSVPSIYAIGDLIPGPMLAHKASAEGIAAAEIIAGRPAEVNYDAIPSIVYTWPQVASVGLSEDQVKERSIPYRTGSYPFAGSGRARCLGETEGFVKVIAHEKTDRILGVHILGPRAEDLIAECVLAMEFGASAEDIARTVHAHPTLSETLMEAAAAVPK